MTPLGQDSETRQIVYETCLCPFTLQRDKSLPVPAVLKNVVYVLGPTVNSILVASAGTVPVIVSLFLSTMGIAGFKHDKLGRLNVAREKNKLTSGPADFTIWANILIKFSDQSCNLSADQSINCCLKFLKQKELRTTIGNWFSDST